MSQNKRPVFTKAMLGYTPREVDIYIDRMNERYSAALTDISRLKRRIAAMRVELEQARKSAELVRNGNEERLCSLIEEEMCRHASALDGILENLKASASVDTTDSVPSTASAATDTDGFVPLDDDMPDDVPTDLICDNNARITDETTLETESALFPEEVPECDIGDDNIPDISEDKFADDVDSLAAFDDIAAACSRESDPLAPFAEEYGPHELDDSGDILAEGGEEATENISQSSEKTSAAKLAESLDFYTDTVVRDGESFDPMTLAHLSTDGRRPKIEDFMRPLGEGESPNGTR